VLNAQSRQAALELESSRQAATRLESSRPAQSGVGPRGGGGRLLQTARVRLCVGLVCYE
jgi:hypothetical protein